MSALAQSSLFAECVTRGWDFHLRHRNNIYQAWIFSGYWETFRQDPDPYVAFTAAFERQLELEANPPTMLNGIRVDGEDMRKSKPTTATEISAIMRALDL